MSDLSQRPLIQSYRPRSFQERGLAAPFTSPLLTGARLRRITPAAPYAGERSALGPVADAAVAKGPDRLRSNALEVMVPNPSGGKGVYILPWADAGAIWRPTMHDVELGRVLCSLIDGPNQKLTPASLRRATLRVAADGLAGRPAAQAAERAMRAHADGLMATRFTLLMRVTEQIEARMGAAAEPLEQASPASIQERGGVALRQLATNLGQPAHLIDSMLDTLALHFVDIGIGMGVAEANLPQLAASMGQLQHSLVAWAQTESMIGGHNTSESGRNARAVAMAAELSARMAEVVMDAARAKVRDMQALIKSALAAPDEIAAFCERPALLLDGWERICLHWHGSGGDQQPRHAALHDILRQVPLLPDEAEGWLALPKGSAARFYEQPDLDLPPACVEQEMFAAIARNERLRAMTV